MKPGKSQLRAMAWLAGVGNAYVIPSKETRALCRTGLMASADDDGEGFLHLTASGYRAIADAIDAGQLRAGPDLDAIRRRNRARAP